MSLDLIIASLKLKYPNLEKKEIRAVAVDILYSGEDANTVLASSSTVDKLINSYRTRQSALSSRVAANDPTTCPICKLPLKPITLVNDRKAVFCQKHFVVFPVKPDSN